MQTGVLVLQIQQVRLELAFLLLSTLTRAVRNDIEMRYEGVKWWKTVLMLKLYVGGSWVLYVYLFSFLH